MRVLLVEDDLDTIDVMCQELSAPDLNLIVARSRDSADKALMGSYFDLVICDLNIPTTDGVLDGTVEHGLAVLTNVQSSAPGTPIVGFSGFGSTPGLTNRLLGLGWREDFLGVGEDQPVLNFLDKTALDECVSEVRRVKAELAALRSIEIAPGLEPVELDPAHRRVLQIYGRRRGGRVLRVATLGGGLSDARVLRVGIDGHQGEHVATLVAKIGSIDAIDDERSRYQQSVAGSLQLGSCPGLVGIVRAGAGPLGGLFYELAGDFPDSLFDVLGRDQALAASIVTRIADVVTPWRQGAPASGLSVASIREAFISTPRAIELLALHGRTLDSSLESTVVQARICLQHGDLHGLNVLVGAASAPLLIDFAEVRHGPAATDAVVLELSAVFHLGAPNRGQGWPTVDQARSWFDLESYTAGCHLADFVRACRTWCFSPGVAAGNREVAAVVYGYCLRQLKYDDTNKELVLALLDASIDRLTA